MILEIKGIQDIENLIDNQIKESLTLEYKEARKNVNEIMKTISAFANAKGGVVIFGVKEKKGIPISISWVNNGGTKEQIENIILSNIQPKLDGYDIRQIDNPENDDQSVFVIMVQESIGTPHMANNIYYIRREFKSEPMGDFEVKNAIFKKGFWDSLLEEMDYNENLAGKIIKKVQELYNYKPENRQFIAFIPFRSEAWKSVLHSGLLAIIRDNYRELLDVYTLIYEINYLIELQKYGHDIIVTQTDLTKPDCGTYLPRLIMDRAQGILSQLMQFKNKYNKK